MTTRKKAIELGKKICRERDKVCQAAGVDKHMCWGHLQASHIYPEGIYRTMAADPVNMIGLCLWHHIYWWHKHPIDAGAWAEKYLTKERQAYLKRASRHKKVMGEKDWKKELTNLREYEEGVA